MLENILSRRVITADVMYIYIYVYIRAALESSKSGAADIHDMRCADRATKPNGISEIDIPARQIPDIDSRGFVNACIYIDVIDLENVYARTYRLCSFRYWASSYISRPASNECDSSHARTYTCTQRRS